MGGLRVIKILHKNLFNVYFVVKYSAGSTLSFFAFLLLSACAGNNVNKLSDTELASFYTDVDKVYNAGKKQQAISEIDSFLMLRPKSVLGRYLSMQIRTRYYYDNGKYDTALLYADSTLFVFFSKKNINSYPDEYAHALLEKGHVFAAQEKYDSAYDYYLKAKLFVAANGKINSGQNEYSYHIAMALFRQLKYKQAVGYFEKAYEEAGACPPERRPLYRMQELLSNIALCFCYFDRNDSAIYYYDSCLSFINMNGDKFGSVKMVESAQSIVYAGKAVAVANVGSADSAAALLKKSIAINIKPGYENNKAQMAKVRLGMLYMALNRFDETKSVLSDLRVSLDTLPNVFAERHWRDMMREYYEKTGQPEKALIYYRKFIEFRDSMTAANRKFSEIDIEHEIEKKEQQYQIKLLKKDNQLSKLYLWVDIGFSLLAIIIIVLVYSDDRKSRKNVRQLTLLNNQVEGQKIELEKKNKEKDRIMDVVVHDLRSPVGGIASLSELLLEEDELPEKQVRAVNMIRKASSNSLVLINELLEYSNATREELKAEVQDIIAIAEEVLRMLQIKAGEKNQLIKAHWDDNIVLVPVNAEKISRVLNNLITNAIKFSPIGASIDVSIERRVSGVLITIKDEGIGIPAKYQLEVFDMFTNLKRRGTAGEKSYGLGLSKTKQIVEAHEGKIWLESEEGNGTTFFVELPL